MMRIINAGLITLAGAAGVPLETSAATMPRINVGAIKCMALSTHFYQSDVLAADIRLALDGYVAGLAAAGIDQKPFRDAFIKVCLRQPGLSVDSATAAALHDMTAAEPH